jgi:hypothetical protein
MLHTPASERAVPPLKPVHDESTRRVALKAIDDWESEGGSWRGRELAERSQSNGMPEMLQEATAAQVRNMEARLKRWGSSFDAFLDEAEEAGTAATGDYRTRVGDLEEKYQAAQRKMEAFKGEALKVPATSAAEGLRVGVERAWNELEAGLTRLTSRRARQGSSARSEESTWPGTK